MSDAAPAASAPRTFKLVVAPVTGLGEALAAWATIGGWPAAGVSMYVPSMFAVLPLSARAVGVVDGVGDGERIQEDGGPRNDVHPAAVVTCRIGFHRVVSKSHRAARNVQAAAVTAACQFDSTVSLARITVPPATYKPPP